MEVGSDVVASLGQLSTVIDHAESFLVQWATTEPLISFVAGASAVILRARLLVLGAILLLVVQVAVIYGYLPEEPVWLMPAAGAFFLIGLIQGAAVTLLGEGGGGEFMARLFFVATVGLVVFLIWRGPRGIILRLLRRGV